MNKSAIRYRFIVIVVAALVLSCLTVRVGAEGAEPAKAHRFGHGVRL